MSLTNPSFIKSTNPSNKTIIGEIPITDQNAIDKIFKCTQEAKAKWGQVKLKDRLNYIKEFKTIVLNESDSIIDLIGNEIGKPKTESYLSEIAPVLELCDWLLNTDNLPKAKTFKLHNPVLWNKNNQIIFEPLGVIGIISPWNYPFSIPLMAVLMAITLGNTVMFKPSEKSSLIGLKIMELFQTANLPDNVVNIVIGDQETGQYFSQLPFNRLVFTGSPKVGKLIMQRAAANLTPVSLELGGKDPAIVLSDAPIDATAQGIVWGGFTNCGQACASVERVYLVKGKNTAKLIDKIVSLTSSLTLGSSQNKNYDIGPIIDEASLKRIDDLVQSAVKDGAKILTGGKIRDDLGGYFYEATVLTDVNHNMQIMRDEIFGPVLPLMTVDTIDQAVDLANDSNFALCASIWTKNTSLAKKLANLITAGTITINDCLFTFACPQLPWGGLKNSGFGRSHSIYNALDFVNIKTISSDTPSRFNKIWWYPYGLQSELIAKTGILSLHLRDINKGINSGISLFKEIKDNLKSK